MRWVPLKSNSELTYSSQAFRVMGLTRRMLHWSKQCKPCQWSKEQQRAVWSSSLLISSPHGIAHGYDSQSFSTDGQFHISANPSLPARNNTWDTPIFKLWPKPIIFMLWQKLKWLISILQYMKINWLNWLYKGRNGNNVQYSSKVWCQQDFKDRNISILFSKDPLKFIRFLPFYSTTENPKINCIGPTLY